MLRFTDKSQCCGCTACSSICPKQCIQMIEDKEGFLYPQINHSTCIDCGLCEKVCPVLHPIQTKEKPAVFAAINNNLEVRMQSSSGGIFTLLAEQIIQRGGVVFGVCFDKNWEVVHRYTETLEGLTCFQGSKYVQSDMGASFQDAKRFLDQGREVLFSGTPCQIAGLKNYLRKSYPTLLTVEVACHGVPSPKVWKSFLAGKRNITQISFRSKCKGWKSYHMILEYEGHKEVIPSGKNPYMSAFLSDLSVRPSCFACPAKINHSQSDALIADFWGIDQIQPEIDDNKGCSLVMVNNTKILSLLHQLDCHLYPQSFDSAIKYNRAIVESFHQPANREFFFSLLSRCVFSTAYRMTTTNNIICRFFRTLYRKL